MVVLTGKPGGQGDRGPVASWPVAFATVPSTVGAGSLTAVTVDATAKTTGTTESWYVNFTTSGAPSIAGIDVEVTFPAGFDVAAASCDASILAVAVLSVITDIAGNVVTCELTLTAVLPGGSAVALTFSGVVDPVTAGVFGPFDIETVDPLLGTPLDSDSSVSVEITASALTGVTVAAPLQTTGRVETWSASFGLVNGIAGGGDVLVAFPDGFVLDSGAPSECLLDGAGILGPVTTAVVGNAVSCTLDAGDAVAAGTTVGLNVTNVRNPTTVQTTSDFSIVTRDAADLVHDEHVGNPAGITASELTAVSVSGSSGRAGSVETWNVTFTAFNDVGATGDIRIVLPAGFETSADGATACEAVVPAGLTITTSVVSPTEVTCGLGALDVLPAGGAVSVNVTNVGNADTGGLTDAWLIQTRNATDAVHDALDSVTGSLVGELAPAAATAPTPRASEVDTWTFTFTTTTELPSSGDVRIVLPAGFTTSSGAPTVCDVTAPGTVAAETTTVVAADEVVCALGAADVVAAGASVSLTLSNLKNPATVGDTGTFTLQTRTATATVLDDNTTLVVTITAAPVGGGGGGGGGTSDARVVVLADAATAALEDATAGSVGTLSLVFPSPSGVSTFSGIVVELPAGFMLTRTNTSACHVLAPPTMRLLATDLAADDRVRCEVAFTDSLVFAERVSVNVTEVQNPEAPGPTGPFTVRLLAASGATLATLELDGVVILPAAAMVLDPPPAAEPAAPDPDDAAEAEGPEVVYRTVPGPGVALVGLVLAALAGWRRRLVD
jgi:hypothetical protein